MESRKSTESGRKAAESWTGLSPQHIIAFFGDTNYINHAQIRYVCEINHSPSGATRPRVSRFISVYVPIGHDLSNTYTHEETHIVCTHLHEHAHTSYHTEPVTDVLREGNVLYWSRPSGRISHYILTVSDEESGMKMVDGLATNEQFVTLPSGSSAKISVEV